MLTGQEKLIIIIPALNEEQNLGRLLSELMRQKGISLNVIVADGGSKDRSREVCETHGAAIIFSAKGRGRQLNFGFSALLSSLAKENASDGDHALLLLHADSYMPDDHFLAKALADWDRTKLGHFALKFKHEIKGYERFMQFYEMKSSLNRRLTINGDQGMLMSMTQARRLFPLSEHFDFLEDQEMIEKARKLNIFTQTLAGNLGTSARRFESEGHHKRMVLSSIIMAMYLAGISDFFTQAPLLYRTQEKGKPLKIAPFYLLLFKLVYRSPGKAYLAARAVRDQLWQCFFYWDFKNHRLLPLQSREMSGPAIRFYDRYVAPWYLLPWSALLCLALTPFYILGSLIYFTLQERKV